MFVRARPALETWFTYWLFEALFESPLGSGVGRYGPGPKLFTMVYGGGCHQYRRCVEWEDMQFLHEAIVDWCAQLAFSNCTN